MSLRARCGRLMRALLACVALQLTAVPLAASSPRPAAAFVIGMKAEPNAERAAKIRKRSARRPTEAVRGAAIRAPRSSHSPPATTTAPWVLVERLYLRLLSIRC